MHQLQPFWSNVCIQRRYAGYVALRPVHTFHKARANGVDPALALAVSYQESGWNMHVVSVANAVGAMQVIPSTTEWISGVVGRRLNPLDPHDNATTGVVLLKILTQTAGDDRTAIAGYYQGLRSVRERGMYPDTRRYVANVMSLRARFR